MADGSRFSRRRLLGGVGSLCVGFGVAGCSGNDEDESGSSSADDGRSDGNGDSQDGDAGEDASGDGSSQDEASGDETSSSPDTDSLDLREANVVDVSVQQDNAQFRVDVTLHHDDNGEDGYANWWQVERLDGTRLGRRELLHAHSEQPFTRSATIGIPDDVGCVVIRGHDQTHGYGGTAMLVALDSGDTRALGQGQKRRSFDEGDCPGGSE
jgi:hypothetical protein